jgi:hypothetical protein
MSEALTEKLSKDEQIQLVKQERIIASGFLHMHDCAAALRVIRDQRLYREFGTFQEYCQKKWGRERATVDYLLQASEQREEIAKNFVEEKPLKILVETAPDSAIRALAKTSKRTQKRALKEAAKKGKLTTKIVNETAVESKPEKETEAAEKPIDWKKRAMNAEFRVVIARLDTIREIIKLLQSFLDPYNDYDGKTVRAIIKRLEKEL